MDPVLLYGGGVGLPILAGAALCPEPLRWALFTLGALIVLLPGGIGIHFALNNPDKLQAERYQLRQASLQMVQGREGPQVVDSVTLVANHAPRLAASSDEFQVER
jgi:hypothetical protein